MGRQVLSAPCSGTAETCDTTEEVTLLQGLNKAAAANQQQAAHQVFDSVEGDASMELLAGSVEPPVPHSTCAHLSRAAYKNCRCEGLRGREKKRCKKQAGNNNGGGGGNGATHESCAHLQGSNYKDCRCEGLRGRRGHRCRRQAGDNVGGGGCVPGGGDWMVNWVQPQLDTRISREGHTKTSCIDLVWAAIEAANSNGFNIPDGYMGTDGEIQGSNGYVWSDQRIPWEQAQPGDVAQFAYWYEYYSREEGGYRTKSTGDEHSALVVSVDGQKLNVYEQNPATAHFGTYHPGLTHDGVLQVFRVAPECPQGQ